MDTFWRHAVDTVSTLKPYVDSHPDIQKYVIQKIIKPSFFKRLLVKNHKLFMIIMQQLLHIHMYWMQH